MSGIGSDRPEILCGRSPRGDPFARMEPAPFSTLRKNTECEGVRKQEQTDFDSTRGGSSVIAQQPIYLFSHSARLRELFASLEDPDNASFAVSPQDFPLLQQKLEADAEIAVVLDVRPKWLRSDVDNILTLLEAHLDKKWTLVALTDGSIPRKYFSRLIRLTRQFLDASAIAADPASLAEALMPLLNESAESARPSSYAVQVGNLKIETWTPEMFPVLRRLEKIARHDVTLLLVGETGTGKTTLAKFMHRMSRRSEGAFQTIACGALPKDLIESELFGHARGAFTGAERSRIGRFEAAAGGTLLLDEIDLLGPPEQAKLLRVIESGEYEMVGSTETRISNARLIVASNVLLEELMEDEKFRTDLYYRLNVLQFRLLPLRERIADVLPLAADMIDAFCDEHQIRIDEIHLDCLHALENYHWPGNLRELKNQLSRSILFAEDKQLKAPDFSEEIRRGAPAADAPAPASRATAALADSPDSLADQVASSEREILLEALQANDFKRIETAKSLGISRVGLYKKMKKYDLLEVKTGLRDSA